MQRVKKKNPFKGLWDAILDLQQKIAELWNSITDLQNTSINLQGQIDALKKECPEDMVEINDYCVDRVANSPASFWQQIKICGNEGKRLCTMAEWNYACQLRYPGVIGIGNVEEWVEGGRFNPAGTCEPASISTTTSLRTSNRYARCCKSL